MSSGVKDLLKNSPIYTIHRYLKTYKDYSKKYGVDLKTTFSEARPVKYDVPLILEKAKINNVGVGDFFYSIDHSVVVKTKDIIVDNNIYNLCSVGRLTHQKGFDILLDDVKKITQNNFNFHLYIIGDGPSEKQLKRQIDCLQLNDYVTLLGAKKNVYSILNKMDGFVLTSRYEGQGMAFLEAKSLGLDIVMPKHLEKYIDGISGTNDIVKSILKLKKHEKKYNSLKSYNNDIIKKINSLLGK